MRIILFCADTVYDCILGLAGLSGSGWFALGAISVAVCYLLGHL